MTKTKSYFIGEAEKREMAEMYDAGNTLMEIVEATGRHHSAVSQALQAADLKRPFKTRNRVVFSIDEMRQLRALADQGLTASEIAAQMPGRRKETINCKLQALGYQRSGHTSRDKREIILRLKDEGRTVREIAKMVGVSKSTAANIFNLDGASRTDQPLLRRVIDGDVCRIYSANGRHEFLVDTDDYDRLPQTSIHRGAGGYPVVRINGVLTYLHHTIMGKPPVGKIVDHINGNRTDCRKANLRFASYSQNSQNAHRRGISKAGYLGVTRRGSRYRASISLNLGTFDTAEDAARVYDAKAIDLFGDFAMTNAKRGMLND